MGHKLKKCHSRYTIDLLSPIGLLMCVGVGGGERGRQSCDKVVFFRPIFLRGPGDIQLMLGTRTQDQTGAKYIIPAGATSRTGPLL